MAEERLVYYKPAPWSGEGDDNTPNVVAMKRGPYCDCRMVPALAPGWLYCRSKCGHVIQAAA